MDKQHFKVGKISIRYTVKTRHLFLWVLACFGYENKKGVVRILIVFHDRPTIQPRINMESARQTFQIVWLNLSLSWKIIKIQTNPTLFSHPKQARTPENRYRFSVFTVNQGTLNNFKKHRVKSRFRRNVFCFQNFKKKRQNLILNINK